MNLQSAEVEIPEEVLEEAAKAETPTQSSSASANTSSPTKSFPDTQPYRVAETLTQSDQISPGTKFMEVKTYDELATIVTEMENPDYRFRPCETSEELRNYLEGKLEEKPPVLIAAMAKERTAEIPASEGLDKAIEELLRETDPFVDEQALESARGAVTHLTAYPVEGAVIFDQFGTSSRDHELRKRWRIAMDRGYGEMFDQVYAGNNQIRGNNMFYVTGGVETLAVLLGPADLPRELQESLEELVNESMHISSVLMSEKFRHMPLMSDNGEMDKIRLVKRCDDLATKTLSLLKEHLDPDNEIPGSIVQIT